MLQTAALCAAGALTGPACNTTTNQANANSGSNTAGQTARWRNWNCCNRWQRILQTKELANQIMLQHAAQCTAGSFDWPSHVTLLQNKPMQIQEVTLLVKQQVAELELAATGGTNTANQGISQSNTAAHFCIMCCR